MLTHTGWVYQRKQCATNAQAQQILANQAAILAAIAAISTGGGSATVENQDAILALLNKPEIC